MHLLGHVSSPISADRPSILRLLPAAVLAFQEILELLRFLPPVVLAQEMLEEAACTLAHGSDTARK